MKNFDPKLLIRQLGLKVTKGRIAVLKILNESPAPLSVQDIIKKIGLNIVDQATVYRIIESLKSKNLVQAVHVEHGHAHYELLSQIHHHHAICQSCGKVEDISKCNIGQLEKEIKLKTGFAKLNRHSLEFFGTCNSCAKK